MVKNKREKETPGGNNFGSFYMESFPFTAISAPPPQPNISPMTFVPTINKSVSQVRYVKFD
jgi:hypothetical protein